MGEDELEFGAKALPRRQLLVVPGLRAQLVEAVSVAAQVRDRLGQGVRVVGRDDDGGAELGELRQSAETAVTTAGTPAASAS